MNPLLQARNLCVARGACTLLHHVSLSLQPADFLVIAGPNGSGKSTLLRALAGIWPAASGELLLDGKPLSASHRKDVARLLSYVPQDTRMDFGFTVREIVAMGRHPHVRRFASETRADRHAVDEAMSLCDVIHLRHRTVNTLSGGERQRVMIARCLAAQPRCILLDEPTASLDLAHALGIFQLARDLAAQGCAIAMATHDLNSGLRFAKSLLLLSEGRVALPAQDAATVPPAVLEAVFGVRAQQLLDADGNPHYLFHRPSSAATHG
ncbi:MAG: ABC transporter ATP-binding protein [Bryobacterales bacterium]|jgi:iron complex transport system ATP-binding protein|nr:ABC transporter ATP-binding protein [Bryobacterales bacterium]